MRKHKSMLEWCFLRIQLNHFYLTWVDLDANLYTIRYLLLNWRFQWFCLMPAYSPSTNGCQVITFLRVLCSHYGWFLSDSAGRRLVSPFYASRWQHTVALLSLKPWSPLSSFLTLRQFWSAPRFLLSASYPPISLLFSLCLTFPFWLAVFQGTQSVWTLTTTDGPKDPELSLSSNSRAFIWERRSKATRCWIIWLRVSRPAYVPLLSYNPTPLSNRYLKQGDDSCIFDIYGSILFRADRAWPLATLVLSDVT